MQSRRPGEMLALPLFLSPMACVQVTSFLCCSKSLAGGNHGELDQAFLGFLIGERLYMPYPSAANELPTCARPPNDKKFDQRCNSGLTESIKTKALEILPSVPSAEADDET